MNSSEPEPFAFAARLRADAATWGGNVSPQVHATLRAIARPRRRAWPWAAAALALAGAATAFAWPRRRTPTPLAVPKVDVAQLESLALAPLEHELACLVHDGRAVARSMFGGLWPGE
jgi:hypothetical protein